VKIEKLYGRYSSIIPDFDSFMRFIRKPLVTSFRINTLKANRQKIISLLNDIRLKQIPFCDDGFYTDMRYPLGNHITHNLGYIYVQEIASMAPFIVLDPKPGEIVLDLCAAPGSKTTQIAQLMANHG
jgi:16S rRNA C967 or C1407 C5-methylase (RsmB/RsmF family)